MRLADQDVETYTEHLLKPFTPLLEPNPRSMKRLVNAYGIARAIDILKGGTTVERKKLALWSILSLRWPLLAQYLEDHPEKINYINKGNEAYYTDVENDNIRDLFSNPNVRDVINGNAKEIDTSLNEGTIRQLVGLRTSDSSAGVMA